MLHSNPRPGGAACEGSALITCLILVVMITILVVGMANTARMERVTVAAHQATQEARLLARMGVHVAMARIAEATKQDPPGFWTTAPGQILRYNTGAAGGTETVEPEEVPLYSGAASEVLEDFSVDLNPPALVQERGLILRDHTVAMPQQWIYLRRDGTFLPPGDEPVYNANNPIVGRFAFWADDAASRINLNTGWTRRSANPQAAGHPSRVEMDAVPGMEEAAVDALNQFRGDHGMFATPDEVQAAHADAATAFADAPELFTHYNHSSILNPWGGARYFLTTQANRLAAGEKLFFDILKTPNTDPGKVSSLNTGKVNTLFSELYTLLSRKGWPMMPERSFVDKYGPKGTAQIVLNLIDAVRSAESPSILVEPIRGTFNPTDGSFAMGATATPNTIMGNARRPLITEMAVRVPLSKVTEGQGSEAKSYYLCQVYVEIYLPESAGGAIDLEADNYTLHIVNFAGTGQAHEAPIIAAEIRGGASTEMEPGSYRTVIQTVKVPADSPNSTPPKNITLRVALSKGTQRIDISPLASAAAIAYTAVPGIAEAGLRSYAVDDPHVKHHTNDWVEGAHTFDAPPANRALGGVAAGSPIQDHDEDGNVVALSVVFPAPGVGVVEGSAGLLSKLHSGMVSLADDGGVPWRTLRFQPSGATPTELPDWLLLELFSSPLGPTGASAAVYPLAADANNGFEARGGLLNVNSRLFPFIEGDEPLTRDVPLHALLKDAPRFASEGAYTAAVENIRQRNAASDGKLYGDKSYLFPGELVEVAGVADGGEASEEGVVQVLELATTRSGVFLIYTMGEQVRQSANGKIIPLGRQQMLHLVEKAGEEVRIVYEEELGL